MTIKSLITELETYDRNLPIVIAKKDKYRNLSYADILFKEDISVNGHKESNAILILGYDD